jgi:hypothetical protein
MSEEALLRLKVFPLGEHAGPGGPDAYFSAGLGMGGWGQGRRRRDGGGNGCNLPSLASFGFDEFWNPPPPLRGGGSFGLKDLRCDKWRVNLLD